MNKPPRGHRSPATNPRPAANAREAPTERRRVQLARIDFVPVTGKAGEEVEARQNAAIKEILLWLHKHRNQ